MQNHAMGSQMDPQLEDRILHEVKSQGVFDEFRKDSMADVDTKPAYQNLRQRVENTVKKFLSEQQWSPDMNKNQLREKLRKHIAEAGFLDVGVERIVDQVVNPKISTVFQPRIEEITYKYLGLPPPPIKHEPPPPPIMHPLPPLPLSGPPLKVDTNSLLPTGLEQISPDSDKATIKSESREDDKSVMDMDIDTDEKVVDDDDESPPFEPLVKCADSNDQKTNEVNREVGDDRKPRASTPKKEPSSEKPIKIEYTPQQELGDGETQDTSASATTSDHEPSKFPSIKVEGDVILSQDSKLSKVSSDSNISDITPNASHSFMDNSSTHNEPATISDQTEAAIELASANISEEAQMPKFNENSSEIAGSKSSASQLHFDIKKDEIKFEGTERKSNLLDQERESNSVLANNSSPDQSVVLSGISETKDPPHHFSNLKIVTDMGPVQTTRGPTTPAVTPTPTPHDSSFGSSLEDVNSQVFTEHSKDRAKNDSVTATNSAFSTPMLVQSDRKESSTTENRRSSSSSRHKKHSKDKRRSHESKEKHRDRDRSKNRDKSRDESRDKQRGKDKYKDKDRNRDKDKIRDKDKDKDRSRDKKRHKDKDRSRTNDIDRKEKERSGDKDRSRKEHKHSKSKNDSNERSDSSKRASSNTDAIKYEKSSKSKHATSVASSSGSSSRSESHDGRREKRDKRDKRESDKKHHSSSSNGNSSKKVDIKTESMKTEIPGDDHNVEKVKVQVSRRRSTDSNDEDRGGGRNVRNGGHERENEFSNSTTTTNGKQTYQPKDTKHTSPSAQSPKRKSNVETSIDILNVVDEPCEVASANDLSIQRHHKKVIILNDMLENPNVNFIDLGLTKTTYSLNTDTATTCSNKSEITPPKLHASGDKQYQLSSSHSASSSNMENDQLLFFEDVNTQFTDRLRLLDNAMDRCRRVVNNLRFDCNNEFCDGLENLEEKLSVNESDDNVSTKSSNILTIDCVPEYTLDDSFRSNAKSGVNLIHNAVNNGAKEKRKRDNKGQLINSKLSPTLSDASVNSKENVALDKNGEELKCVRRIATVNKLNQQQRYNSEDLYKPRPVLSQRSRRRGVNTMI